jgi:hypothetical protein
MNRDDIVKLAQEAAIMPPDWGATENQWRSLEAFAKLVAEHEREECAKAVEEWLHGEWHNQGVIAALMIRERGAP